MAIIHLSDLHLRSDSGAETNRRFDRLCDRLLSDEFSAEDIVAITGDLIDSAWDDGSMRVAASAIGRLRGKFGGRIVIAPGNHDYGNGLGGDSRFIEQFFSAFALYLCSDSPIPRHDYLADAGPFASPFPVVRQIGDTLLIALDSMEEELCSVSRPDPGFNFGAEGELGKRQLRALQRLLADPRVNGSKVVVCLHHHPFRNMLIANRFRDAEQFCAVLRNSGRRIDALLFGHNHHFQDVSDEAAKHAVRLALEGDSLKDARDDKCSFRRIDLFAIEPAYCIKRIEA